MPQWGQGKKSAPGGENSALTGQHSRWSQDELQVAQAISPYDFTNITQPKGWEGLQIIHPMIQSLL